MAMSDANSPAADTEVRLPAELRADCTRCMGLCCVVPAFYSFQGFGFDKPAHTPCRNLTPGNRCTIHSDLVGHGFPGCADFDCYGAGQRVSQDLFAGVSWRTSGPLVTERIFSAYSACVSIHRLMGVLVMAEASVPADRLALLHEKHKQLDALCRSEEAQTGKLDLAALKRDVFSLVAPAALRED
jgi:hypothetical protein